MSEITTDFTVLFDDQDALDFAHKGFLLALKGKNEDAIVHFNKNNFALWFNNDASAWELDSYEKDGKFLKGFIVSGTISFDEEDFMQSMAEMGVKYSIANIYNSQVGESHSLAFIGKKKSNSNAVLKELSKIDPTYALGIAIDKERTKEAKKLIQEGVNPNGNIARRPFIEVAAENGMHAIVKALLEAGANPSAKAPSIYNSEHDYYSGGETALHHAAISYSGSKLLKLLIQYQADPNVKDANGNTPLHACLPSYDHRKYMESLIEAGADIDIKNNDGLTPLLYLLDQGDEDEDIKTKLNDVKHLLSHGADPHTKCHHGGNALWYSAGDTDIEEFLKELGITDLETPDNAYYGITESDMATAILHNDMVKFSQIISNCTEVDKNKQADFLIGAASYNRLEMAKKLIEIGVSPYEKGSGANAGMQAYKIADFYGFTDLSNYFRAEAKNEIEREEKLIEEAKIIFNKLIAALKKYNRDESNYEEVKSFFHDDRLACFEGSEERERMYFKHLSYGAMHGSSNQAFNLKEDGVVEATKINNMAENFVVTLRENNNLFKVVV